MTPACYPYACACGYREDIWAESVLFGKVLDKRPPRCPRCGKPMTRKSSPSARVEDNPT